MIFINEWLPNPTGDDGKGEFVELFNNSSNTTNLSGWILSDGKKKVSLSGHSIPAGGYLVLKKEQTKLTLKNTDGGLSLYGPKGHLLDRGTFAGSAPEGKSYSRIDYGTADVNHFAFSNPTPGAKNSVSVPLISSISYPAGVVLNPPLGTSGFLECIIADAAVFIAVFFYVIQKKENISQLLFGGDEEIGY